MSNANYEIYLDHIQIDDFTGDMQDIAEQVGVENALKIVELFGGLEVHFPVLKSVTRKARERVVCKEYCEQHYSFNEIARRHGLSVVWVRKIIKDNLTKKKTVATVHGAPIKPNTAVNKEMRN